MLATEIHQINSDAEFKSTLAENDQVMVCCGRNGPMCLPVYDVMENLQSRYSKVAFRVLEFDGPFAHNIRNLPETRGFMGLPFTVYFKGGKVVGATSSIQTKAQVSAILDKQFGE